MRHCLVCIPLFLITLGAGEGSVVGWRMNTSGDFPEAKPPIEFGPEKNQTWATPMPGVSTASPIVVGDSIICLSDPDIILCLDKMTGAIRWQSGNAPESCLSGKAKEDFETLAKNGGKVQSKKAGKQVTNTCCTPTSDGKRIFAFFQNGVAVAYDKEGKLLWSRFVSAVLDKGYGQSMSPALAGKFLVIHVDNMIYGLSADDGRVLWKEEELMHQASPVAMRAGTVDLVLTTNGNIRRAETGEIVGKVGAPNLALFATAVVSDGGRRATYLPDNRMLATVEVTLDPDGKIKVKTKAAGIPKGLYYASPLITEDRIYLCDQIAYENKREKGKDKVIHVLDSTTLKSVAEIPIPQAGWLYPSPIRANGQIYFATDKGTVLVVKPDGTSYPIIATNQIDPFRSSPICDGNRLYIRTDKKLCCFQAP